MNLKQAKENGNMAYLYWVVGGTHEACDELNDSNIETIKAFITEFPDAVGYKFYSGIVEVKNAERLYNFCCDYVFNGTPENIEKVQEIHEKYMQSKALSDLHELENTLGAANGICFLWS